MTRQDLARLDPGAADPIALVRASFDFLLESRTQGLDLAGVRPHGIGSIDFPEYEIEIRRRISG